MRFSHFCTGHGRLSSGRLTPPGEYDWTCASFGKLESTAQTANWSVNFSRFCTAHGRNCLYFTMGAPIHLSCPFPWGDLDPCNTWFLEPTRVLNANGNSIASAVFAGLTSVTDWQTDRQTDRPRYSDTLKPHTRFMWIQTFRHFCVAIWNSERFNPLVNYFI